MVQVKFARKWLSAALIATGALAAVAIPQSSSASAGLYVQYESAVPRYDSYPTPRYDSYPTPRHDSYPGVRHGYIWVPGYWDWRGYRQVWIDGTWTRDRHVHHNQPRHWQEHHYGWQERHHDWRQGRGRWDRDGDGIPDNRDPYPNNPRR